MGTAILVEYYDELPASGGDADRSSRVNRGRALETFQRQAAGRYSEGTLQRLLAGFDVRGRRAGALALGMLGTRESNRHLARALHDDDPEVRALAAEGLWSLWFRLEGDDDARELHRLARMRNPERALAGLDSLLCKSPEFAEAYNQRAVVHFRLGDYPHSIADCRAALRRNPFHFGAHAGMAQCYMKMRRPRSALKSFRNALRINPGLEGVRETIRALEDVLGGGGKRDDKK